MDCWIELVSQLNSLHFKAQLLPFLLQTDAAVESQCLWRKVIAAALLNSLEAARLFPSVCGLRAYVVHNVTPMTNNHPSQLSNAVSQ